MTFYLVAWIGLSCPGGLLSGLIPKAARLFICERKPESFLAPWRIEAERKVRESGESSRLYECRGLRCREIEIRRETLVSFGK